MRKLLRRMAKAEMERRGYSKVNRRMRMPGGWRAVVGAYPINRVTGAKMSRSYHGEKKYKKGHRSHLFAY